MKCGALHIRGDAVSEYRSCRSLKGSTVMVKLVKFAVVSAIFLLSFAYSHSALSRNHSLTYQEAVWMCGTGNLQACEVMYAHEMARSGVPGGSPADQW